MPASDDDDLSILPQDYSLAQLREHIRIKLGGSVWRLEGLGLDQMSTIDTAISEALSAYSIRVPMVQFRTLRLTPSKRDYDIDAGYGVARVDFIMQNLTIAPILSSTLGVTPVLNMEGRDFDLFLRWRKTFQRVTSTESKWHYNEEAKQLFIYCAVPGAVAGVQSYHPRKFSSVRLVHKTWLRKASVAHARLILGENRSKFDDSIPAPDRDIKMNGNKLKEEAQAELEKLEEQLFSFQVKPVALFS